MNARISFRVAVMRCLRLFVLYSLLTSLATAEAPKLWSEDKITLTQPFEAAVIAAGGVSPWSGTTTIYLMELGDKKRICLATLKLATATNLDDLVVYKIIDQKEYASLRATLAQEPSSYHACLFIPSVPLDRFVWISPLGKIGNPFGEGDLLRIVASRLVDDAEQQKQSNKPEIATPRNPSD